MNIAGGNTFREIFPEDDDQQNDKELPISEKEQNCKMMNCLEKELIDIAREKSSNGRCIYLYGFNKMNEYLRKLCNENNAQVMGFVEENDIYIDGETVFSIEKIRGKAKEFYVLVTDGYSKDLEDKLHDLGYSREEDYFYFNDGVIENRKDYFEDKHGNVIYNKPSNVHVCFYGCNNTIRFSLANRYYQGVVIRLGEENDLDFGGVDFRNANITVGDRTIMKICKSCEAYNSEINIGNNCELTLRNECKIINSRIVTGDETTFIIDDNSMFEGDVFLRKNSIVRIGKESTVCADLVCYEFAKIIIGDRTTIGGPSNVNIAFQQKNIFYVVNNSELIIGDECLFSIGVKILCGDAHLIFDKGTEEVLSTEINKVVIHNHVWIGEDVSILDGTDIGEGSIVGTRTLVNSFFPKNVVIAGSPGKVIKTDRGWK